MGNLSIGLNNTQFGEVTWQHASDASMDLTFSAKLVTDLNLNYQVSDNLSVNLALNNLLNVYPDVIDTKGDFVTDLGGRFKYPWEVNQFGFMGTNFMGTISYDF
jgi:iron complex outermembrane receptor protein